MKLIEFKKEGIFCRQGNFYIDPWLPVENAVITHAHSDHARSGSRKYLCHTLSKNIMLYRLGANTRIETLPYGETVFINGVKLSLHPAGHIIGSSQIRLEYKGYVAVISGDYKTEDDGISTAFEVVKCHCFVTESTFGLPVYNWLPQKDIYAKVKHWIDFNRQDNRTSIFIAYSLGKAQRLMKALEGYGDIIVHSAIANMNRAIEQSGITLPKYIILHETPKEKIQNNIVIVTSALLGTNIIKKIPNGATAVCSGWMQIRGNRRWQAVDAGFAISDHADWNGLLQTVKATEAETVYVTHGYQSIFTKYLNETGIQAYEVATQFGNETDEGTVNTEAS